jgi:ABC-type nitrate/sulfonate/bicarbonate transport system substrate-binding protein
MATLKTYINKSLFTALAALLMIAAAVAAGCNGVPSNSNRNPAMQAATLRLQWIPDAVFVGDYVALQKNYWKQSGLDVKIEPGGFEFSSIKMVAAGTNDFGVSNLPQLLEARANGVPVIAIGVIIPRSPIGWVSKKDGGITKPQDFIGKKVGAQIGTHTEVTFDALMAKLGLDKDKVNRVPVKFDPQPFLSGDIDVLPVYLIDQPYLLQANGVQLNSIDPFDYGVEMHYGNVYITREDLLRSEPDKVRKFLEGAYRGWQNTLSNSDEALNTFVSQNSDLNKEITGRKLRATLDMMTKGSRDILQIARFDPAKVETTKQLLVQYGGLKEVDASKAFTNDFIPKSIAQNP